MNIKNKIIIIVLSLILIGWWTYWFFFLKNNMSWNNNTNTGSLFNTDSWELDEDYSGIDKWNKKNQISDLKKKLALKWLIIKWDLYFGGIKQYWDA